MKNRGLVQRVLEAYKIRAFYYITNTLTDSLVEIKYMIFTYAQKRVFRLGFVDCDTFYIRESSRKILTSAKEHLSHTKIPLNNSIELKNPQVRSEIGVRGMFNNNQ